MNILHVYKSYITDSTGGVEKVIEQLCVTTAAQGIRNRIISLSSQHSSAVLSLPEAEVFRYPISFQLSSSPFSWAALRSFKALAQWADIIHYHFPWPFADVLHFSTAHGKPTVLTYHSDIIRQKIGLLLYQPLQHYFLKSIDAIVATSPQYLATSCMLQRFQYKTQVIPIGLDDASYPPVDPERLKFWQGQLGRKFFLFVGVMRYYKGLPILLKACQGTIHPVVIIGSGPMEAQLKEQLKQLNLTNVYLLGALPEQDKVALLHLCFAVIFPSHLRAEAFGVSLLEGAMYGKPLISTQMGTGTCYINIHHQTGLVVPPNDVLALRAAMQWLVDHPQQAAVMGIAAQTRYRQYFTANLMKESYIRLYEQLLR